MANDRTAPGGMGMLLLALLEGRDMTHTEPNKRDVNTVFQNYALFPNMTVRQNI